jgi:hypothetical protein
MLRTHRSLKAYCATVVMKMKSNISFLIFPNNGAPMEWNWQSSWKNLSQCHFVHHKSQMDWPGIEPEPPRWETSGCESWLLTLKKAYSLSCSENTVRGKIFGPKSEEVTGDWRKLHSEELHDLYSSPDISRVIKSRRMKLVRYMTLWLRKGMHTESCGKLKERYN